jgi:hypothetical protein
MVATDGSCFMIIATISNLGSIFILPGWTAAKDRHLVCGSLTRILPDITIKMAISIWNRHMM